MTSHVTTLSSLIVVSALLRQGSTLTVSKANRSREEARAESAREDGRCGNSALRLGTADKAKDTIKQLL